MPVAIRRDLDFDRTYSNNGSGEGLSVKYVYKYEGICLFVFK